MNVTKNRLDDSLNFISENIDVAFAWACYYCKNGDSVYINNKKYQCIKVFNGRISFADNGITEFGNWYCMNSLEDNKCLYATMDKVRELRENNPLSNDYICFTEKQFCNA